VLSGQVYRLTKRDRQWLAEAGIVSIRTRSPREQRSLKRAHGEGSVNAAAYYNEIDPFAAAWLRELIRRNLICVGEVDERSIEVVQPDDLRGFIQCHFFAGIGVWSLRTQTSRMGQTIDLFGQAVAPVRRSLRWQGKTLPPVRWCASCPACWTDWLLRVLPLRPRMARGRSSPIPGTLETRRRAPPSALLWGTGCEPRRPRVARTLFAHDAGRSLGYAVGACDTSAAIVGAPHIRQRLYFVAQSGELGRSRAA
jgi:DNA (cytosine-5)-methyltransferase 1